MARKFLLLLYKEEIRGEVVRGTKELVVMNLTNMDNTTKTTIMRTLASNVVVIEQRDVNNNIAHFSSNQYMSHQNNKKGDNDHI